MKMVKIQNRKDILANLDNKIENIENSESKNSIKLLLLFSNCNRI